MGGSSFDVIVQEIMKQKLLLDQMEEENRDLRRQLADLRDGRGIFLDIGGRRFALVSDGFRIVNGLVTQSEPEQDMYQLQEQPMKRIAMYEMAEAPTEAIPERADMTKMPAENEADEASDAADDEIMDDLDDTMAMADKPTHPNRETPIPANNFLTEDDKTPPPFLEELMIDEFKSAISNPRAVWSPPHPPQAKKQAGKLEMSDEEKKAVLRRELLGSFLLE
jgi:hypothetical protein